MKVVTTFFLCNIQTPPWFHFIDYNSKITNVEHIKSRFKALTLLTPIHGFKRKFLDMYGGVSLSLICIVLFKLYARANEFKFQVNLPDISGKNVTFASIIIWIKFNVRFKIFVSPYMQLNRIKKKKKNFDQLVKNRDTRINRFDLGIFII